MQSSSDIMRARLPIELYYIVLNYLADNKAALATFSLVCSYWADLARPYLFHTLNVESKAFSHRFSAFSTFLATTHFGHYVRDLTMSWAEYSTAKPEKVSLKLLRSILVALPNLSRLVLDGISLLPDTTPDSNTPLASRPRLDALSFEGCFFHDIDLTVAFDVVRLFGAVDELSFHGHWCSKTTMDLGRGMIVPSTTAVRHVQWVRLSEAATRMLREFLVGGSGGSLRKRNGVPESVHFTWNTQEEAREFQGFLSGAAECLKLLELKPLNRRADVDAWFTFELTPCTQLETLTLHMFGRRDICTALRAYTHLFAHSPPPALRDVKVVVEMMEYVIGNPLLDNGARSCWANMGEALGRLASLKSATVELRVLPGSPAQYRETLTGELQAALRVVRDRGILRVAIVVSSTVRSSVFVGSIRHCQETFDIDEDDSLPFLNTH
ncbi:hypothetical protein BD413DRAFT_232202 [Trametes elegans]|nr:hypothetical protein BD413DRAFT_232202 [Trametes elegans]